MSEVAFLDMPATRARLARFTVEQYHQIGEYSATGRRTELIRGYVFDKMSKSPLHSSIGTRLYDLLHPQLPAGWWLRKEEPLTLADSEPEPDLSIVPGTDSDYRASHPHTAALVIEIAITTLAEDRALAALYAEAGVGEYWIILPRERQMEVYRRPGNGVYAERILIEGSAQLECGSVPGVRVTLGELFA